VPLLIEQWIKVSATSEFTHFHQARAQLGGTFMVLINGRGHCCWADWGCVECDLDETRCIIECIIPKCCEVNGSEGGSCIIFESGSDAIRDEAFDEFADLQVQEGTVGVEDCFVDIL
jgi:hypothetical protein